jgi:hypothetical protein
MAGHPMTAKPNNNEASPALGEGIPTVAGYYWFTGLTLWRGEWRLVEVFRPYWCDRNRQDLRWRYLDRSGGEESKSDVATCAGQWSAQVLPPSSPAAPTTPAVSDSHLRE